MLWERYVMLYRNVLIDVDYVPSEVDSTQVYKLQAYLSKRGREVSCKDTQHNVGSGSPG